MPKTSSVALREFIATVTTKGFIFGVVIFPAIMTAAIPLIVGLMNRAAPSVKGEVAVVDRSGALTDVEARLAKFSRREKAREMAESLPQVVPGMDPEAIERQMQASLPEDDLSVRMLDPGVDLEAEKTALYMDQDVDRPRRALVIVPREAVFGEVETGQDARVPGGDEQTPDQLREPALPPPFGSFEMFVSPRLDPEIQSQIRQAVSSAIIDARVAADPRVQAANLSRDYLSALMNTSRPTVKAVTEKGEKEAFDAAAFMIPMAFMFLLWVSVFTAGQFLLYSTIEEKSSRVMEVLLSAVSPMQLMVGKIVGQLGVGLVILGIYAGVGIMALVAFAAMHIIEWTDLFFLVIFFLIAFFTIACLMAAVGAAVNDVKEANALMGPIMVVLIIPMILWMPISRDPNAVYSQVLSFVPGVNPFVMVIRISGSEEIPLWQIPAAIVVGVLSAMALAWLAAKIFRIGALMYGKPPNFRTLLRWIRMA